MSKRSNLKTISLLTMTIMQVMIFCVCFSVAWFSARRRVDNAGSDIIVGEIEYIEDIKIFQWKGREKDGAYIEFYKTEATAQVDERGPKDVGYYNLMDNNYQVLVEVTLTDAALSATNFNLYAQTYATKSHLTLDNNGEPDFPLTNVQGELNSLSSIIDMFVFVTGGIVDDTDCYRVYKDQNNNEGRSNFIDTNDDIIDDKKFLLSSFTSNELITSNNKKKFFIMLDYNEENCAKLYGNNLGTPAVEIGHRQYSELQLPVLDFETDFAFILNSIGATANED